MRAALSLELLKLARSALGRVVTALLVLGVPLVSVGLLAAAEHDGAGSIAVKARLLVIGTGGSALASGTGQIMSVAVLLAVGFVISWAFGREFADHTVEALLMSRPSRFALASAKIAAVLIWAVCTCGLALGVSLGAGAVLGLAGGGVWPEIGRAFVGAVLAALLAVPFALVATLARSALAGVGAVIGVIVVTQVATALGAGAWFPYAAPSLWLGMGGPDMSASPGQLLLVLPVAAAGWWATAWWWQRAQLTSE